MLTHISRSLIFRHTVLILTLVMLWLLYTATLVRHTYTTMVTEFNISTTVDEIVAYDGIIDPSTDLKVVKKETLLKYIMYLNVELRAKSIALSELSQTFKETTQNLKNTCIDAATSPIVNKIDQLQTSIANSVPNCEVNNDINERLDAMQSSLNDIIGKDSGDDDSNGNACADNSKAMEVEPFSSLTDTFLDEEPYKNLSEYLPAIDFKAVGDQREVCYFGDFQYRYTGGQYEPAAIPDAIRDVMNLIDSKHPESKIVSCLVTKYTDGHHYCPAHSDNERTIDPSSDIFTLSIGAKRDIEFSSIKDDIKRTQSLSDNSLLLAT